MQRNFLIWIIAVSISCVSGAAALGAIAKNKAPDLALSIVPTNGFAAEKKAKNLIIAEIAKNQGQFPSSVQPAFYELAVDAFTAEPATPDAVAILALGSGSNARSKLMQRAFELSRRQQLVTAWMVSDGASRNDISAVLRSYDVILRTSSSSISVAIPAMVTALENRDSIAPFVKVLEPNPPWAESFWIKASTAPASISNAAELRKTLFRPDEFDGTYRDRDLIGTLIKEAKFEEADMLYDLLSSSENKVVVIRNGDFSSAPKYPPLDWQLASTGEFGAFIDQGGLHLSAIPSSGGVFARQLVRLPKKILNLKMVLNQKVPNEANLHLDFSCADDVKEKPRAIKIPLSGINITKKISNENSICEHYWLSVVGRSSEGSAGFDIVVDSITLYPS